MANFNSLDSYRANIAARLIALKQGGMISSMASAEFLKLNAKRLAPKKSGQTIRGIRKRRRKTGYIVESTVNGSFKQNMWANQSAPFRRPRMRWNMDRPTLYGDGSHMTTGTPRFFHFATLRSRKVLLNTTRKNTLKALRLKVV